MTMKIIVVNDDANRSVQVDTIETAEEGEGMLRANVTKQDEIEPGKHKEFWLHQHQSVAVREK